MRVSDYLRGVRFVLALLFALLIPVASAAALPPGFSESTVLSGLGQPTVVKFAADGRVFVASKNGVVHAFDDVTDATPSVYTRVNTYDYWDRGLLGMALDPGFTRGAPTSTSSTPTTAPGSARLSTPPTTRLSGRRARSRLEPGRHREVLINDFCQHFLSHSVGSLAFGPDGMLYVSAATAPPSWADYGQRRRTRAAIRPAGEERCARSPSARDGCDVLGRRVLRVDPDDRARRARATRRRRGSSPTACATRSGSRSVRARSETGPATSGGIRSRRSTGSPTPHAAQLRLAVLRGQGPPGGVRRAGASRPAPRWRATDVEKPY